MLSSDSDKNLADCSFSTCVQSVAVLNLLLPLLSPDCYNFVCGDLLGTGPLSVVTTVLHLLNKGIFE